MRIGGWITFPLAAISLGVAVRCGNVDARSSEAPGQDSPTSVSSSDTLDSTDTTNAAQSGPAIEEMSVFSRPRTEADVLPSELSYLLQPHACTEWHRAHGGCLGEPLPDESRLLLSGLGVRSTSLYAWPTTKGWVCWARAEGGGGCVRDFADAKATRVAFMGIDPDNEGVGYPGTLVGVVPDDVAAAEVQVRGVRHAAIVDANGIFYELPDGSCTNWAFESLTATYRDGSSDTVPIEWHHGARELPETCAG
jgi:hypothetical protein